ncbi:TPA: histidine kinase [Patescibacteria group bacterium]|nr:MAG: Sensory transduction regulatory protein [Parcubacteria group bacterium GW2011_GWD2_42_14]HCC05143.1 histidine kinase [Patescibacteria group bacterium]
MNKKPIKPVEGLNFELSKAIVETLSEPIVVLNSKLQVVVANHAFYNRFNVDSKKINGKRFDALGTGEWDVPALTLLLEKIIPDKTKVEGYEIVHTIENLGLRVMLLNARTIVGSESNDIFVSITDITEERKALRDKENLMLQKDTLLKEMRHRIANSLQLIASIILLKAESVTSEESKAHLEDAHDRIISIATVQRNLDPISEGSLVPVVNYLRILCTSLTKSMIGGRKPITLKVVGGTGSAKPDDAIALGLITTELVINSLKHAFPKGEGQVTVTYSSDAGKWMLSVGDDGVGLEATSPNKEGLGTNIIESLAQQLQAKVDRVSTARGTVVSITHMRPVATE